MKTIYTLTPYKVKVDTGEITFWYIVAQPCSHMWHSKEHYKACMETMKKYFKCCESLPPKLFDKMAFFENLRLLDV